MRSERVVLQLAKDAQGEALVLTLREPCGQDELAVTGVDTRSTVELLDRLIEPGPGGTPPALRLAARDRDALMAALHRLCWSDRIEATLRCRACDEPFDMDFQLSELQRQLAPRALEGKPDWRIPVAEDELAVAALPAREAVRSLAHRCGVQNGDITIASGYLDAAAPFLDLDLQATCPECGEGQSLRFDMQSYLLQRILSERERLLDEVHILASSYGWSLTEILNLPRITRQDLARRIPGTRLS